MKKSNIVSVDLKAFFGSLLEQWKLVVIVAVIVAVLMPCAMSKKVNGEAEDEANTYRELSAMSDEEKLNTLPELDRVRVSLALEQKAIIEAQEEYYANSIVDTMLGSGVLPVLDLKWAVSDSDNVQALNSAYGAVFTGTETTTALRNALGSEYANTEDIYINELITVKYDDGLELVVIIPEGSDTEAIKNAVIGVADAAGTELSGEFGKHKLTLVSAEETTVIDEDRIAAKTEKDIQYKDLKEYYTSLLLEFDHNENVVFDSITVDDDSRSVYVDPGIDFSPKMIVAGFAIGIIAYIFAYLAYVVLSSKVHDSSAVTDMLGTELLGSISKYSHKGIGVVVFSKIVYGLLRKKTIDGKSVDSVSDAAVYICKHAEFGKVLLVNSGLKKDYSEESKKLTDKINKVSGVEAKAVDSIDAKALDGVDAVILGVCSGSTRYADLIDIARLCDHCGKKIIGGVYYD